MNISRCIIAGIIINEEKKVLLCKRSMKKKVFPGIWHMPGGGFEDDESILECIKRELDEELDVDVIEVADNIDIYDEYETDDGIHHVNFIPIKIEGNIELDEENDEYKWVAYEELEDYIQPEKLDTNRSAMKKAIEIGLISKIN